MKDKKTKSKEKVKGFDVNRLRKKMLAQYESADKRGGGDRLKSLPEGTSAWRFLPYKVDSDGDPVYVFIRATHFLGSAGGVKTCQTPLGRECYICEWRNKRLADPDTEPDIAAVADALYPRQEFILLGVEIDPETSKPVSGELQAVRVPKTVMEVINSHYASAEWGDVLSPTNGSTLTVTKTQKGSRPMDVRYSAAFGRNSGPIFKKEEKMKALLKKAYDLEKKYGRIEATEDLKAALKACKNDVEFVARARDDVRDRKQYRAEQAKLKGKGKK